MEKSQHRHQSRRHKAKHRARECNRAYAKYCLDIESQSLFACSWTHADTPQMAELHRQWLEYGIPSPIVPNHTFDKRPDGFMVTLSEEHSGKINTSIGDMLSKWVYNSFLAPAASPDGHSSLYDSPKIASLIESVRSSVSTYMAHLPDGDALYEPGTDPWTTNTRPIDIPPPEAITISFGVPRDPGIISEASFRELERVYGRTVGEIQGKITNEKVTDQTQGAEDPQEDPPS